MPILLGPFSLHEPAVQRTIDRGIAHYTLSLLQLYPLRDLLWRPLLLSQQPHHGLPHPTLFQHIFPSASLPPLFISFLCLGRPVASLCSIPSQLSADGGYRPSYLLGDAPQTFSCDPIFPYTFSLAYAKMLVVTRWGSPPSGLCRNYHFSWGSLSSHYFISTVALVL